MLNVINNALFDIESNKPEELEAVIRLAQKVNENTIAKAYNELRRTVLKDFSTFDITDKLYYIRYYDTDSGKVTVLEYDFYADKGEPKISREEYGSEKIHSLLPSHSFTIEDRGFDPSSVDDSGRVEA